MKKIRFLRPKGLVPVGHVGDYPDLDADHFIEQDIAELVVDQPASAEPDPDSDPSLDSEMED